MTPRVLVAGGTGRLGTQVVRRLTSRGIDVRVLTRDPKRAAHLAAEHIDVMVGDVRDVRPLTTATAGVDVVVSAVHGFAGRGVSPKTVDRDGNALLIRAAQAAGAEMVLMSVVGAAPDSPFELFCMKYAAETVLTASEVPFTIVRSTAFLELWVDILTSTAGSSNRPLIFGRGRNPINFVSTLDVAALVERVTTDRTTRGQTLEIGGPENLTLDELGRMVVEHRGGHGGLRHLPRRALRTMAATVGRLRPELGRQARAALAMDQYDMTFSSLGGVRSRFADLPCTSPVDALHAADLAT